MDCFLNTDIKKGTIIYTIENCKIEQYFVEEMYLKIESNINVLNKNINNFVYLKLERYDDGTNSYKTEKKLSHCFLNKEDLIKQL